MLLGRVPVSPTSQAVAHTPPSRVWDFPAAPCGASCCWGVQGVARRLAPNALADIQVTSVTSVLSSTARPSHTGQRPEALSERPPL